jgi:hypothetical protein
MSIGGVVIQFAAETGKAVRDIGKLTTSLGKVDDQTGTTNTTFGKLKTNWGKVAGVAAIAAPVIGAIGTAMWDVAQAAIADNAEAEKLAHTLGNVKGVTDDAIAANAAWIDAMELATYVSDTELRDAIGKLTLATGDLGEAQDLTTIAVAAAAGSGKSLATITDAMAKAAGGNAGALKRLFPWLKTNKDGTLDLKTATKQLTDAYGGSATEAAKNAPPQKKLAVIWGQMEEALGQGVLPALDDFSDWMSDEGNQADIKAVIDLVGALSKIFGQQLANTINAVAAALRAVAAGFDAIKRAWNNLPSIARSAAGGGGSWGRAVTATAAPAAGLTAGVTAAPTQVTVAMPRQAQVIVTEEQVFRAVSRLLLKGQARNGRMVVVG